MTSLTRQNTLFVSEDWIRIYEAIENVDFRAYDSDNLVAAIFNHLRETFPEEFNDWIASSEFVLKVEVLAWLSQNIAFRVDLNTRENFLATAERRESLLRLAENVAFKINRVKSAQGFAKIDSVSTNEPLVDSNNINVQDRDIIWNDPRNEDWFEQFILIMNSALTVRTPFGRPVVRHVDGTSQIDQYILNSVAPSSGAYNFSTVVNGINLPFDVINPSVDKDTGEIGEIVPTSNNAFNVLYRQDGLGLSSTGTGFFVYLKQGTLSFQDEDFTEPVIIRTVDVNTPNINNEDFFVQELAEDGSVLTEWTRVDDVFGEGVSFNTEASTVFKIYELDTLVNDAVRVRFGDGKFGAIPQARFRFWRRTANAQPQTVKTTAVESERIVLPYISNNEVFFLTITFSLKEDLVNAAATETDSDIRTRANRIFYTQNRMVTAEDYNSFFLKDNAIRKVKSVNRTFAGHSRFSKLTDPTGLYQNLKIIADDGRFFVDNTLTVSFVSGDTTSLPVDTLIANNIKPLIQKVDKSLLYYENYSPIVFNDTNTDTRLNGLDPLQPYFWEESVVVADQSRGNITDGTVNNHLPVGTGNTSTNLKYVNADSIINLSIGTIKLAYVDRVTESGQAESGIILRDIISDGAEVLSVTPAFRTIFTGDELFNIENQLNLKLDFGISWDYVTLTWNVIIFENLDKTGTFSLANQNDTSATNADASWMIMLEFIPGGTTEDQWKITDRGLGYFFASAREHDFFFANNEPIINPETGGLENDRLTILACNETRDSNRRQCIDENVIFIGDDSNTLFVSDVLRHADGYIDTSGVLVTPSDEDNSGFFDNPYLFEDLVIDDGVIDLVLWRQVEEQGFTVFEPVNRTTTPKGTYGTQAKGFPAAGEKIETKTIPYDTPPPGGDPCLIIAYVSGDIHYDQTTSQWLVANGQNTVNFTEGEWEVANDQSDFKFRTGRDNLTFKWEHYSPDSFRIDPSKSNVMDAYILTTTYDDSYRTWLFNDGEAADEPTQPTSESLRIQFADFDNFKTVSDAIIFHSSKFKPLFGRQADPEVQATFKIVQSQASTVSENDIKLRTLAAIDQFFAVDNWDFGEKFYFTELATFIHNTLTPDINSVVIVPKSSDQTFGRLFQVRSEPDELFVSAASADDVEIVSSLTDEELRIGSFTA